MAYRGKIGFHFPGRGNPNIDTGDIKFLPAGITNPTSSDLVQIDKVYAIPAGTTITSVAQLQNYIVWEKVAGYVKYILHIYWDSDTNMAIQGVYLNGNLAGSVLTNAEHIQTNGSWTAVDSTKLEGLRNGTANVDQYGYAIRLTFTTSNATSLGFNTNEHYHGNVSNVNIEVIGVDSENNETVLHQYSDTINNNGTYRYAV